MRNQPPPISTHTYYVGARSSLVLAQFTTLKVGFQYPDLPSWILISVLNIQGALVYIWGGSCAIVVRFESVVQFVCKYSWEDGPPIQQPFLSSIYRFKYCIQVLMRRERKLKNHFPPNLDVFIFQSSRLQLICTTKIKTSNQTHKTHRRLHSIVHQDSA